MCCWPCVIIGCYNIPRHVDEVPENHQNPPQRVFCAACGATSRGEYYRNDRWFAICFIPICPVSKGFPYLKCGLCNSRISNIQAKSCSQCRQSLSATYAFCPACGEGAENDAPPPTFPHTQN